MDNTRTAEIMNVNGIMALRHADHQAECGYQELDLTCSPGRQSVGTAVHFTPVWVFPISRDLLWSAAKLETAFFCLFKPQHYYFSICIVTSMKCPLTITFSPQWTQAASFLSWGRQSTALPTHKTVIFTLTVENMHLANCQRQYPFASLIPSTYIQRGSETDVLNYIIYKIFILNSWGWKVKGQAPSSVPQMLSSKAKRWNRNSNPLHY